MLTEKAIRQIERDLWEARNRKRNEANTAYVGGEDPSGARPGADDVGRGPTTAGSIKALADTGFRERNDFFKLSQIIKGLAAVFDKDLAARDFLMKIGAAIKDLAGGGEWRSSGGNNRTEPSDEEPLKNHPKRELPGVEDVSLGEMFMPTRQVKSLNVVSGQLSNATKRLGFELNRLTDEIQGGIDDDNRKRVARMIQKVANTWADIGELMDVVGDNIRTLRSKVQESVDSRDGLSPLVLAEMLDAIIERSKAEPITGRQWQELRGFADFISKDAARVAQAVASKDPAEVLDKAKTMVTNVEILIKRMAGIYPSMDKVADLLDRAGREILRAIG